MLAWPAFLPAPTRDGFSATLPDGVRRTPMDQGISKRRGESSATGGVESYEAHWEPADFETFLDFWKEAKAERFTLDHWFWGASEAAFTAAPRVERRKKYFVVRFELEVWALGM